MSIQRSYDKWAGSYDTDENLTRDLDGTATRQMVDGMPFVSILEAGCGTGKNTSFFAQVARTVCGMDFSDGMLHKACHKMDVSNTAFVLSDLTRIWPLAQGNFDLVSSTPCSSILGELSFVFSEAGRLPADGGSVFVSELHPFRQYRGKRAEFEGAEGRT